MGSDRGAATRVVRSAVVDPSGGGDRGWLFSPDPEGRGSGSALEGGGRSRGASPPADMAGIKGGRRRKEGGKERGLKCPSRQLLLCDAGYRSREGETRVFPGWGRKFAAPPKNFCRPGRYAGSGRAGFPARIGILAVILRVGADAGSVRVALIGADELVHTIAALISPPCTLGTFTGVSIEGAHRLRAQPAPCLG